MVLNNVLKTSAKDVRFVDKRKNKFVDSRTTSLPVIL
jgi:hypothetical protein